MDLNVDYFKIEHNGVAPAQGKILISEPFLQDTYFKRSVVLLVSYDKGHFVGYVLNKFTEMNIHDAAKDFPAFDAKLSVGGPVRVDTIHFIHTLGTLIPETIQVTENLWWSGDFSAVRELISKGKILPRQIRFFIGYSGWEPMQLENEISENSWLVADMETENIMNCNANLWNDALSNLGSRYKLWTKYPENPGLN
ncbi:MAG: hypothetical protein A2275_00130 [Bacteroidetes bacterium RIFOXYA12_FULL_35_11]|nr:MAG: hypothetical protein A2X01_15750 [Bacteroidetes bacterium GWF2_35_48]OFY82161.1 MAG: hypothetical protein A2275_00130 [Bacteroidetes bacterium RIFOXYA12_FULL_35_11]OFZ05652.1 MAG: hypothetical protein A2491_20375 [Bacteroidetes bacterium RIFOXYC12_FULL_35_7]HBX52707.1 hypothetical protein [Bacteroidales bacterium]